MNGKQILLFGFCVLAATAAQADELRNGMYYTARSPALREQSDGELRTLTYAKPDATPIENPKVIEQGAAQQDQDEAAPAKDADAAQTPSDKVWEKYKSLAAGTADKDNADQTLKVARPSDPTPPQAPQVAAPAPVGIAGIIQEYQKTKASRSEMHTLVITPPSEAEKIEAETEKKREENPALAEQPPANTIAPSAGQ